MNEEKGSKILHEVGMLSGDDLVITPFGINTEKFSSLSRLIRVTTWCFRLLTNLRGKMVQGHLNDQEISNSIRRWTECIQTRNFSELIKLMESNKRHSLHNLGVYKDNDGLLKCKGRLRIVGKNNPILLPKNDHFTKLVIIAAHKRLIHAGATQTLAEMRRVKVIGLFKEYL